MCRPPGCSCEELPRFRIAVNHGCVAFLLKAFLMSQSAQSPQGASFVQRIGRLLADQRFLRMFGQFVFFVIIMVVLVQNWTNIYDALASRNLTPNFDFMNNRAGFEIGGAPDYSPNMPYWSAFMVGMRNTLSIIVAGLIGATVLGILAGIFLLSHNWLVRNITRGIVEVLRNTPLLVQIFFAFFVVVLALPSLRDSIGIPPEAAWVIPFRWLAYAAALVIGWYALRRAGSWARVVGWAAIITAIITLEVALTRLPAVAPGTTPLLIAGIAGLALAVLGAYGPRRLPALVGLGLGLMIGAMLAAVLRDMPPAGIRIETSPVIFLNNRGLYYPSVYPTGRFAVWAAFIGLGIGLAALVFQQQRRAQETTGQPRHYWRNALLLAVGLTAGGWLIILAQPAVETVPVVVDGALTRVPVAQAFADEQITLNEALLAAPAPLAALAPVRQGLRFVNGQSLTPEYVALLLALVVYTASFIAEVVRAGILAVPHGQLEAGRALGLTQPQMLRMIILPQALRVIIPPLTNQYLNLAKNSSLAIAISFADVYAVMNTVGNQSGQSVTSIIIVMLTYLIISLIISAAMNWVNARFQLVTR